MLPTKENVILKTFWNAVKHFLTNRGRLSNSDIMLVDKDEIITTEKIQVKNFKQPLREAGGFR